MPINQLSLSRQFECRCMLTKSNRANTFAETADAQRQTPLLLRIAASGHFEISPESKQQRRSFFPFKRNFPYISTQSHTPTRLQSCRSEPVSVSSMPSANRLPTPASPSLRDAHTRPQPTPMLPFLDLLSLAFNSSGPLPSVPRLSTSGLPS